MSRRNWNIVFATIGIALALALGFQSYQFYQAAEQQRASYTYQPARAPGFRIDAKTQSPTPHYKPSCNNPNNSEDADLCAQWAAVDQVAEANRLASLNVRLAIITFVLTAIGTTALLFTLQETRAVARRELRSYVSVEMVGLEFTLGNGKAEASIMLKNGGQTPAYLCHHSGNVFVRTDEEAERDIMHRSHVSLGRAQPFTLHLNDPQGGTVYNHEKISLADLKEVVDGDKWLYIFATVFYQDTFGIDRQTRICVKTDDLEFPSDDPKKWPVQRPAPRPCTWLMADFHNDST